MPREHFDVIVIGTGGVGSAALYHCASRGASVLGLDRYPPGHDRGSSHGETRMIRLSYFEQLTVPQIAERLGKGISAANSQLMRALTRLARVLAD